MEQGPQLNEPRYSALFTANAETIRTSDRLTGDILDRVWSGLAFPTDAAQSSALDALVAGIPDWISPPPRNT